MKCSTSSTTPNLLRKQTNVPKHEEPTFRDRNRLTNGLYTPTRGEGVLLSEIAVIPDTTETMYSVERNNNISNLYSIGSQKRKDLGQTSMPFVHTVELKGPKGETVRFRSVFDDGALANAIDEKMYVTSKNRLSALEPSPRILKMADGRLVPSLGMWKGQVTVKGVSHQGAFEVLNSNGAWALLFGKPLLETFSAVHDYSKDIINLPQGKEWVTLENQFVNVHGVAKALLANLTIDIKQLICTSGDRTPPSPIGTPHQNLHVEQSLTADEPVGEPDQGIAHIVEVSETEERVSDTAEDTLANEPKDEWNHLWLLDPAAGNSPTHPGAEQPDITKSFEPSLLTRKTDPHNPARVKAILSEITLGQDLTRESIRLVISEHAECFALSMSEVKPVEGAALRLDIPRDKKFRTKINQRPQSPPQKTFFNEVINKMLDADIIRPIAHQDVKCCGATTLAKKTHEGDSITLDNPKTPPK